jgi:hypothetical protein
VISFDASAKWEGLDGLGDEILAGMRAKGRDLVMDAGNLLVSEIKMTLTGARSGRRYKVSRTGKEHVASAPGEAPAVLTGALSNSIGRTEPKWSGWECSVEVGSGLGKSQTENEQARGYAKLLEYGGEIPARFMMVRDHWRRMDQAFGRPIPPRSVMVGGHWRTTSSVRIAARPYMAPSELRAEPSIHALFDRGLP